MTVDDLICHSAGGAIALQRPDGSFPPGHNGPWQNIDTPVRVTAHWLILLIRAHALSGDARIREAARKACEFLLHPDRRPGQHAFHCCVSDNPFMAANGLIGQAWVLEALLEAGTALDERCLAIAETLAGQHQFHPQLALWHPLGVGGETAPVHHTLNHQLWLTVMIYRLARLRNLAELEARARLFFVNLPRIARLQRRYVHMLVSEAYRPQHSPGRNLLHQLGKLRHAIEEFREARRVKQQSLGYLSFTLHGLAMLHEADPQLPLWHDETSQRMLRSSVAFADEAVFNLRVNPYAFSYNPTGIEMAYVKQRFGAMTSGSRSANDWLDRQFREHYDFDRGLMNRRSSDPNILAARLYEACRLDGKSEIRASS